MQASQPRYLFKDAGTSTQVELFKDAGTSTQVELFKDADIQYSSHKIQAPQPS